MLSRVANSIYWMSRYLERADNVARFVRVNNHLMLDLGLERKSSRWEPLLYASGDDEEFFEKYGELNEKNVLHFLTFDTSNPNSIISCIQNARENARTVRENIPSEMWESINELYHFTKKNSRRTRIDDFNAFYEKIQFMGHSTAGYAEDMMLHGEPWHFSRMGRMLERSDKTARLIDIKYFSLSSAHKQQNLAYDVLEWSAVLKSVNASEMYRKKYHLFDQRNIVSFLIFDEHVPRSLKFCVNASLTSLKAILGKDSLNEPVLREMSILQQSFAGINVDDVLTSGLHQFVDVFQYNLNVVDEYIYSTFFSSSDYDTGSDSKFRNTIGIQ